MDCLIIKGGKTLNGEVEAGGSKNASLPILIATLLNSGQTQLKRVPGLQDIRSTLDLLGSLGATSTWSPETNTVVIDGSRVNSTFASYDLVRKMRASVLVLGPLLARFGEAKVSLPGGCAIGARPVDLHLKAMEALGAEIILEEGYILAKAKNGLKGCDFTFSFPSVGATENAVMAAVLAHGTTRFHGCAKEPEIVDMARALRAMGYSVEGEGTDTIVIEGKPLATKPVIYSVMGDRIEAGTYLLAGAITHGKVRVTGIEPDTLRAVLDVCVKSGMKIEEGKDWISLDASGTPYRGTSIKTLPFPGFPTDMQAQWMAVMTMAQGDTSIEETIFENRFMHVPELARFGADIRVQGGSATVHGVKELKAAPVMATDLRASASLILAALVAKGTSKILRIYHLDRGYERLEQKLTALGADVVRAKE
jgi:UDP-N-acetylglucosamine 1-carboxyvinyltransferase